MLRRCASIVFGLSTSCSATSRFVRPGGDEVGDLALAAGERAERLAGLAPHAVAEAAQLAHRLVAPADGAEAVERRLGGA